jgi:hypothetical protein
LEEQKRQQQIVEYQEKQKQLEEQQRQQQIVEYQLKQKQYQFIELFLCFSGVV